jgi:hypothetical protein
MEVESSKAGLILIGLPQGLNALRIEPGIHFGFISAEAGSDTDQESAGESAEKNQDHDLGCEFCDSWQAGVPRTDQWFSSFLK